MSDGSRFISRRTLVIAGVGVAALGAGIAVGVLRSKPSAQTSDTGGAGANVGGAPRNWGKEAFDKPDGGKLALADFSGKLLLLNFWATWCPPCVREMPLLHRFYSEHRQQGWQVLGLALDKIDAVRTFLAQHPVGYPIGVTDLEALEWVRALGNVGGGLPFSVAFDSSGALAQKKLGEIASSDLQAWVQAVR